MKYSVLSAESMRCVWVFVVAFIYSSFSRTMQNYRRRRCHCDHITLLWAIFVFVVVDRPKEDNDSSNKECQFGRHGLCACCDLRTAVHVDQKSNATCFFSISVLKNISDLLVLETTDPNSQARYICRFILVHDWKGFEQSWKMEIVRFAYHFRFGSQNSPHGYQFENTEQCI